MDDCKNERPFNTQEQVIYNTLSKINGITIKQDNQTYYAVDLSEEDFEVKLNNDSGKFEIFLKDELVLKQFKDFIGVNNSKGGRIYANTEDEEIKFTLEWGLDSNNSAYLNLDGGIINSAVIGNSVTFPKQDLINEALGNAIQSLNDKILLTDAKIDVLQNTYNAGSLTNILLNQDSLEDDLYMEITQGQYFKMKDEYWLEIPDNNIIYLKIAFLLNKVGGGSRDVKIKIFGTTKEETITLKGTDTYAYIREIEFLASELKVGVALALQIDNTSNNQEVIISSTPQVKSLRFLGQYEGGSNQLVFQHENILQTNILKEFEDINWAYQYGENPGGPEREILNWIYINDTIDKFFVWDLKWKSTGDENDVFLTFQSKVSFGRGIVNTDIDMSGGRIIKTQSEVDLFILENASMNNIYLDRAYVAVLPGEDKTPDDVIPRHEIEEMLERINPVSSSQTLNPESTTEITLTEGGVYKIVQGDNNDGGISLNSSNNTFEYLYDKRCYNDYDKKFLLEGGGSDSINTSYPTNTTQITFVSAPTLESYVIEHYLIYTGIRILLYSRILTWKPPTSEFPNERLNVLSETFGSIIGNVLKITNNSVREAQLQLQKVGRQDVT